MKEPNVAELQAQIDHWQRELNRTHLTAERRALQVAIEYVKKQIEQAEKP
jgi:hypothetical protein